MPAEVIPFGRKPEPEHETEHQHRRGRVRCGGCGHIWEAVQPVPKEDRTKTGAPEFMECSACGAKKGVYLHFVEYVNTSVWTCSHCAGVLYSIVLAKGDDVCVSCANCGCLTNALDIFNKP